MPVPSVGAEGIEAWVRSRCRPRHALRLVTVRARGGAFLAETLDVRVCFPLFSAFCRAFWGSLSPLMREPGAGAGLNARSSGKTQTVGGRRAGRE